MSHFRSEQTPNSIPHDAVSLSDYQRLSEARLDDSVNSYLNGAAADQLTMKANLAAWSGNTKPIVPRVLADLEGINTGVKLLGRELNSPIVIAPTAYHKLFHEDGELATMAAADALGIPYIVSTQASTSLEDIAAQREMAPLWFQLYFQKNRAATERLVRRAEDAGYEAIVVTVDAPINGIRNAEERARFQLPEGVEAVNLEPDGGLGGRENTSAFDPEFIASLPTWESINQLQKLTKLPILLKGIMHPEDARRAVDRGVSGIIVSNHGGRTLDTVATTQSALGDIVKAVNGEAAVLVDGGIRRGTDVLQAMAMGADAVLIGRPVLHGLSVAGALGVAHVIQLLQHELEVGMVLAGCRDFKQVKENF